MKVTTVGSAMIDSIAIIDDANIERLSMSNAGASYLLLEQGRKMPAKEISQHCGGGGVNAAVGLARQGHDVALLAAAGNDLRADRILQLLEAEGVASSYLQRDERDSTGSSILIGAHDRDLSIFTYRGANALLDASKVPDEALARDLVYVAPLSNEAADAFPELVRRAKVLGAKVAANPGVRQLTRRGDAFFACLDQLDILSMNCIEAGALAPRIVDQFGEGGPPLLAERPEDTPALARNGIVAQGYDISLRKFMTALNQLGVGCVLITDGAAGAYACDGDEIRFRPAASADVVGTVGAGDAFASTFACWLAETGDLAAALDAAALNAASVVGHVDAQTGLLHKGALSERIQAIQSQSTQYPLWRIS